jgi:hypothetical protein
MFKIDPQVALLLLLLLQRNIFERDREASHIGVTFGG